MNKLFALTVVAFAMATFGTSTAEAHWLGHPSSKQSPKIELQQARIAFWHGFYGVRTARSVITYIRGNKHETIWNPDPYRRLIASSRMVQAKRSFRAHSWLMGYGRRMIREAQERMLPPIPHKNGWLCIHRFEGSWDDYGDPYWGGLQMDRGFMKTYGSDFEARFGGFANVWPVWAQMEAAERAYSGYHGYKGRGYGPWPNTARDCGLL